MWEGTRDQSASEADRVQCMRHARARLEKATVLRKIASWPPHPASSHVIMQRFTKRTVNLDE